MYSFDEFNVAFIRRKPECKKRGHDYRIWGWNGFLESDTKVVAENEEPFSPSMSVQPKATTLIFLYLYISVARELMLLNTIYVDPLL